MEHKFRWQPAQRHTWCECGKWEGFLGHFPERAEHKALWAAHVAESERPAQRLELADEIKAFENQCEDESYTDTGRAWDLLSRAELLLRAGA